MAKKGARVIVTLECTEARKEGKSPSRYTTT
ncbi:MAG: 50S ribosomal protein L33, partial [Bacteriovorax sp.]|nr:50S ribosomal protein L33 [Bacteriovorax sp.]